MKSMTPMEKTMLALDAMKDIELPMDPAYYDDLHARIMTSIDRAEPRPPATETRYARANQPQFSLRDHLKSWLSIVE